MIRVSLAASAALLASQAAFAGGIERTTQSVGIIFETGNYVEFAFTSANPKVSGTGVLVTPGAASGDMAPSYSTAGVAFKMPISDKIDVALIFDQPFGADVAYPFSPYYAGSAGPSTATLDSSALTGVVKYKFNDSFSVFGGIRHQSMTAQVSIPFIGGYTATGSKSYNFGYLVGAAYERPEIALRVALTYNSSINHSLKTTETSVLAPLGVSSPTKIETPQSVNLEFQTGIAKNTLVFGSVRWAEWSKFSIDPAHYAALTGGASLVSYADDVFTYKLGVGHRLNENWAIAASATYEKANGGVKSNLSPTDGKRAVGVGVTYTLDNMKIQAGISKIWIGDATTSLLGLAPAGNFTDNSALGFGMKIGFSF